MAHFVSTFASPSADTVGMSRQFWYVVLGFAVAALAIAAGYLLTTLL